MDTQISSGPDDTVAAGRRLAATLPAGSVVALSGDLGAGKTHFVRGLVRGWEGDEHATSPTFALIHEYSTPRGPVFHLDFYRASGPHEIWSAAHDELHAPDGLVVMEWADRFPELVPATAIRIRIEHAGEGRRRILREK
jgi:tRNA threonylcarbamoyladenosine biosynthesis protein TsaE